MAGTEFRKAHRQIAQLRDREAFRGWLVRMVPSFLASKAISACVSPLPGSSHVMRSSELFETAGPVTLTENRASGNSRSTCFQGL